MGASKEIGFEPKNSSPDKEETSCEKTSLEGFAYEHYWMVMDTPFSEMPNHQPVED
jgi:hypothetical protein